VDTFLLYDFFVIIAILTWLIVGGAFYEYSTPDRGVVENKVSTDG